MNDYYTLLEIPANASTEKIREQYRLLAHAWHPDKFPTPDQKAKATEKMKQLNEAYETLSNTSRRKSYDRQLREQSYAQHQDAQHQDPQHKGAQPESKPPRPEPTPAAAKEVGSPVCPQCQKDDQIKKVTAIVENRQAPVLAQSLEPPTQPTYPVEPPFTERLGRRSKLEEYQKLVQVYTQAMERWKRVMVLWNQLYYCDRDGCVFLPGAHQSAPLLEMAPYLYDLEEKQ